MHIHPSGPSSAFVFFQTKETKWQKQCLWNPPPPPPRRLYNPPPPPRHLWNPPPSRRFWNLPPLSPARRLYNSSPPQRHLYNPPPPSRRLYNPPPSPRRLWNPLPPSRRQSGLLNQSLRFSLGLQTSIRDVSHVETRCSLMRSWSHRSGRMQGGRTSNPFSLRLHSSVTLMGLRQVVHLLHPQLSTSETAR